MYYLSKFKRGSAKKQIKRILNISKSYELDEENLFITKKGTRLEVPKREDRKAIVDRYHAMSAHFGANATISRIKEKYWWPKMYQEVSNFINKCGQCVRNNDYKTLNHPAIANKVTNFNYEVSIDWSWGFVKTKDEYIGVMFVVEESTKHVKTYTVKAKSTDEYAGKFLEYCCLFGPPKRIRSDNEPAFISDIMNKLKEKLGVEWHKTIAAYNPSHNGLVEKFVHTFTRTLRKLTEKDQSRWDEWLPFIELAYNTRVHSTTKITPYEATFGVKCNGFEDWTNEPDRNESDQLAENAKRIERLVEIRKLAVDNIVEAQEKQKDKQNKRTTRIVRTFLERGTVVYRKNDGMITKLEPRWIGPYTIFDHDERGNYLLLDSLGNGIQTKYPLEKLKLLSQDKIEENLFEVKELINDRRVDNKMEYLVRWKDNSKDSWIKEEDFQTIEVINDYWKNKIRESEGVLQKKRGRPKKLGNVLNMILQIMFMFTMLNFADAAKSWYPKFCTTNERTSVIDVEQLCIFKKLEKNQFSEFSTKDAVVKIIVLDKMHHEVSGKGYRCQMERIDMDCSKSFFGVETCLKSEWKTVKLEEKDCWHMVKTQHCKFESKDFTYDKKLECDTHGCSIEDFPVEKFNWMDTNNLHGYKCSYYSVSILAENSTGELFYDNNCKVKDYKCQIEKSILVWDKSVIHSCPFEQVEISGDFKSDGTVLINYDSNIVLQPVTKVMGCNMELFRTNEGLFITKQANSATLQLHNVKPSKDNNIINKLMLANLDFDELTSIKWLEFIDTQVCTVYSVLMQVYRHLEGEFLRITNSKGEEAILYTKNGLIYGPECVEITKMDTPEDTTKCYREIPVTFTHNGEKRTGFLTTDRIIKLVGYEVDCKLDSDIVVFSQHSFQRKGKNIIKKTRKEYNWIISNLVKNELRQLNTHHPDAVLIGYDELKVISEIMPQHEGTNTYYVEPIPDDLSRGLAEKWIDGIKSKFINIFKTLKNYIFIIIIIIIGILFFLIFSYTSLRTKCFGAGKIIKGKVRNIILDRNFRRLAEEDFEMSDLLSSTKSSLKNVGKSNERLKRLL